MVHDESSETCWQCGAPAERGCVYTQSLVNRTPYADGCGHSVTTLGRISIVKISVPRCGACQIRNYLASGLLVAGFLIGACIGGLQFPSKGITTILGGVAGLIPGALLVLYDRRVGGRRSLEDYPALKQLRAAGWQDPD
jgi:hypothetical protein